MSARATDVVFSLYNLSSLAVDFHTNRSRYPVEYRSQTGRESKTLRSFISFRDLSRRKQRCVLRRSSSRCALCHRELVNGYKREAFQWIHYVGQPIRRRRASVAVETGPDGTDCVDELLISLSFTKTERNFRSGSAECKQTVERHCAGRKEECKCIWWGVNIPHAQVTHLNSV